MVSTPVQSQRARTRTSLRRRASQRTSGEPKAKYVVDVHHNRLVQVNGSQLAYGVLTSWGALAPRVHQTPGDGFLPVTIPT